MEAIQKNLSKKPEKDKSTYAESSSKKLSDSIKKNNNLINQKLNLLQILPGVIFFTGLLFLIITVYNNKEITMIQMANVIGYGLVLLTISLVSLIIIQTQIKKIKSIFLSGLIILLILFFANYIYSTDIENQIIRITEYHNLMSVPAISTLIEIELDLEYDHGIVLGFGLGKDNLIDHKRYLDQIENKIQIYNSLTFEKNSFGDFLAEEQMQQRMLNFSGSLTNSFDIYNSHVENLITKISNGDSQLDSALNAIDSEREGLHQMLREAKQMEMEGQKNSQNQISQFSKISQFSNLFFFGFVILSILSVILIINRSFKKNIKILATTTEKISKGSFGSRVEFEEETEFNELGKKINQMATALGYYHLKSIQNEKQRAIGELAARISHDIRNPLSVLKMEFEVLKRQKKLDEKQINRMKNSIERINHQVNEVLDFVRQPTLEFSKFNLSTLISNVLETIKIPSEITINKTNDEIFIFADKHHIEILLINLIINSIQEIEKTGTIDIAVSETDTDTILEITDSGPGISLVPMEQIFEPLVTTKQKGTGLGLVSVKSIVEKHKGTISVKNNPTTFTIKIPRDKK